MSQHPMTFRDNQVVQTFAFSGLSIYAALSFLTFVTLKQFDFLGHAVWWRMQWYFFSEPAGTWILPIEYHLVIWPPLLIALLVAFLAAKSTARKLDPNAITHLEGREPVLDVKEAAKILSAEWSNPGPGATQLAPGLPAIPRSRAVMGGIVTGGTGAGKTVLLSNLVNAIMAGNADGSAKIILHDVKGDFTAQIPCGEIQYNGKRSIPYLLIAPWDKRGWIHEIAADVATLAHARLFAENVIQESRTSPMFSNAARQLLTGFCVYLQETRPGRWGYADLAALITMPPEKILPLIDQYHPEARLAVCESNVTTLGIQINLIAFASPILDLARAWPIAPEPSKGFSLRQWLLAEKTSRPILILQNDSSFAPMANALHSALLAVAAQVVTSPALSESHTRAIWFLLDEFPQLSKSAGESVDKIMALGRSKGSRMWILSQGVEQLVEKYGIHKTKSWLGMVGTIFIGKSSMDEAQDWSKRLGKRRVRKTEFTQTDTGNGTNWTSANPEVEKNVVDASVIEGLGEVKGKNAVDFLLPVAERYLLKIRIPFADNTAHRPAVDYADWTAFPSPDQRLIDLAKRIAESDGTSTGVNDDEEKAKCLLENMAARQQVDTGSVQATSPDMALTPQQRFALRKQQSEDVSHAGGANT